MNYRSAKRQGKKPSGAPSEGGEVVRVRTPRKTDGEVLGTVTGMLGGSRVTVQCMDSVTRMCRIRGKMKKRTWVREGDTVIVVPWDVQDEKGDVVWRYTGPQVNWLGRKGFLNIE
ncbi:MAG TPA: translation initiation factor eIF-1A [Methanocella sp.]|jgi:translation initiation factor 1A